MVIRLEISLVVDIISSRILSLDYLDYGIF